MYLLPLKVISWELGVPENNCNESGLSNDFWNQPKLIAKVVGKIVQSMTTTTISNQTEYSLGGINV
eukprot:7807434-Ditylum_brightwellii.AAC.1